MHLPWSPGVSNDDRIMPTIPFEGERVIVTEKLDGENTTMYRDHIHARSLETAYHPSRNWVKSFHGTFCYRMPEWMRICGENMFAQHSIQYDDLESYFYGFSIWSGVICLDWDTTMGWLEDFGIPSAPILYDGIYDRDVLTQIENNMDFEKQEGYTIRSASLFPMIEFSSRVGKYV